MHTDPVFLFAGGGSGGHISPGLAIAERVRELRPSARCIFLCSRRAIDREMLVDAGAEHVPLPAAPFGLSPLVVTRFALQFLRSRRAVRRLIARAQPTRLIALGGFVAAPAVSAAAGRVPVTLMNLDAPPGRANLAMARHCDEVLSAVELPDMPGFAARVVGMPIRRRAIASPLTAAQCREKLGLDPLLQTLLITGASQGALSINQMMIAIATGPDAQLLRGNRQVLHLAGAGEQTIAELKKAYAAAGVQAVVLSFLHNMGLAWGSASGDGLAISRAGASSVAEAWTNAVPTIFMPYPYHADEHQRHNARPMEAAGGAVIVRDLIDAQQNAAHIAPVLQRLQNDRVELEAMSARLRQTMPPDAAATIARHLLNTVEQT